MIQEDSHKSPMAANSGPSLFLGLIEEKYVKSFVGAAHGISAILSLVLGAFVFFAKTLCLTDDTAGGSTFFSHIVYILFLSNMISSTIVATFFWNKVQSWRLGTTKTKDRGVTPMQMQNANRGRGVVTLILQSLYPLVVATAPRSLLDDFFFSAVVALSMIGLALYVLYLLKDYFKPLILVFGWLQIGLAAAILTHGSISTLNKEYPLLINHVEQEASFVITLCQHGFLMYYLRSRKLIAEETVNIQSKLSHQFGFNMNTARGIIRAWNLFPSLPVLMLPQALVLLVGGIIQFCVKVKPHWGNGKKQRPPAHPVDEKDRLGELKEKTRQGNLRSASNVLVTSRKKSITSPVANRSTERRE